MGPIRVMTVWAVGVGWGWGQIAWTLSFSSFPAEIPARGVCAQGTESNESNLVRRRAFLQKVAQSPGQSANLPC